MYIVETDQEREARFAKREAERIHILNKLVATANPALVQQDKVALVNFIEDYITESNYMTPYQPSYWVQNFHGPRRFQYGFVFDRSTNIFFVGNMCHSIMASCLYVIRKGDDVTKLFDMAYHVFKQDTYVEDYHIEGMGFTCSSMAKRELMIGEDVSMDAREKILFRDFKIIRI